MFLLKKNCFSIVLCMLMILLCFSGCTQDGEPEPTVPQWKWLREKAEYLTVIATEEDFPLLEECINLEYLDLTGSTCYDAILGYMAAHPHVEVVYTAPLGNLVLTNSETGAALEPNTYDFSSLQKQLKYLPALKSLALPKTALSSADLAALQEAFPELKLVYSVELLGRECLTDTTELDLSGLTPDQLESAIGQLALLPELQQVELMDASGNSTLGLEDVKHLMDALPDVTFHYTFDLFGKTLSTTEERVEFEDEKIGNAGEEEIRAALDIMPNCTYFRLEDCGLSNEVLGGIQADYPNTKIVWRVYFGPYSFRTDEETIRAVYNVNDKHVDTLKYCTSAKYIDMGHNTELSDLSFVAHMPDLEIMIASGCIAKNLDGFENCKKLEFLELAYCYDLTDISPLKECESLRFLNISFAAVTDLSPIEDLSLERFLYLDPRISEEDQAEFEAAHPDCWARFTGENPYSLGWRYDDIGETFSEYYLHVRDVFDLDAVDKRIEKEKAEQEAQREKEEAEKEQESAGSTPPASSETPPATEAPPATESPAPPPATDPPAPPAPAPDPAPDPASAPDPEPES